MGRCSFVLAVHPISFTVSLFAFGIRMVVSIIPTPILAGFNA